MNYEQPYTEYPKMDESFLLEARTGSGSLALPRVYPNQGPLRWQDDMTGRLPNAVRALFHQPRSITRQQMALLDDYCSYYINAPCWFTAGMEDDFERLRREIGGITDAAHLQHWLSSALELGIDPF